MDEQKLHTLMEKMVDEMGAIFNGALVLVGDKLGLYETLANKGPATVEEFAEMTGMAERYLREWLSAQAASGYVEYDAQRDAFSMSPEQAMVFADDDSPVNLLGAFYTASALYHGEPKLVEAFRSGAGIGWGEHHGNLFCGTARFFGAAYRNFLVQQWLPALDGVTDTLSKGGRVADVGCGYGQSTLLMAQAFPQAQFVGFDLHAPSIEQARAAADAAGITNIHFEVASAKDFPDEDWDLVTSFDCLHDLGDPVGAAVHVRDTLAENGSWMIVEPFANDTLANNLNPVGRISYSASTMFCTPCSLSQEVGLALGAQAGEARLNKVIAAGGFSRIRRATETPFNMVFEARP